MSKGLYHAGTWATLHSTQYVKIHHAILAIYRTLVDGGQNYLGHMPSDESACEQGSKGALLPIGVCVQ
eukprot:12121471-Karenia_brevis.AAC.1